MTRSAWQWLLRIAGALGATASSLGGVWVIQKLYTGRGGETPIRSALLEQPLVFLLALAGTILGLYLAVFPAKVWEARPWLNPVWIWRHRRGEVFLLVASGIFSLFSLEVGSRAIYAQQLRFPFFYAKEHIVYPPLFEQFHDYSDDGTHVALLGGSVLHFAGKEGVVETAFKEPARVYNLAQTAHSSLDSLTKFKYALDRGYRFDYAIFYHGINDVRANNVPPELFSVEYNHYFFYRLTNTVFGDRNPVLRALLNSALVFRAERLVTQLRETRLFGRKLVHMAFPREDWLQYGGDVKSRESFERNLLEITALCKAHGITLIVPEFAYHPLLDDYVRGEELEWSEEEMIRFAEQWGLPAYVQKGMQVHNEVIREHADEYVFLETGVLMRHENFVDPCHFASPAQREFLEMLVETLRSLEASA